MDFWSRLIGGTGSSPSRAGSRGPDERLNTFKRACTKLQQIWRAGVPLSQDDTATAQARTCLERMNIILAEESRAPVPHPCLPFASSSQIYVHATRLAISSYDNDLIRAATAFLTILIENDEDIVASYTFARALISLAGRGVGAQGVSLGEEEDASLVELLFNVANKIRLDPNILPAWFAFKSSAQDKEAQRDAEQAPAVRREDFPLFYLLMDYVHHEGRSGDFARTGLLYVIETASESKDLERWLIESDLATLMASGLGAMYSQLSRKLTFASFGGPVPAIIAISDPDYENAEISEPTDLQAHMDAFLSYLMFWQDTLEHCRSVEVKETLLDHFQVLFLQQLLYPSLLESSDVDGGSTFSVLIYLSCILDAVNHPDIIRRTLEYLLASPPQLRNPRTPRHRMSLSRRKSFDMLTVLAESDENPSPTLFNLVDLISLSLQSKNQCTVAAVLKLLSVIIRKHHHYALTSLFNLDSDRCLSLKTIDEIDDFTLNLLSCAGTINSLENVNDSYEGYLKDASNTLENHPCSAHLLRPAVLNLDGQDIEPTRPDGDIERGLVIRLDGNAFVQVITVLRTLFTNDVMTNLSLTETVINLASCGLIRPDGWLLPDAIAQSDEKDEGRETASRSSSPSPSMGMKIKNAFPSVHQSITSPLFEALGVHLQQIQQWREEMTDFDELLDARKRHLFRARDLESHSTAVQLPEIRGESPTLPSFQEDTTPRRILRLQSRSTSPRGRKARLFDHSGSNSEVNSTPQSRSPVPIIARKRNPWASPLREISSVHDRETSRSVDGSDAGDEINIIENLNRNLTLRLPPASRIAMDGEAIETDTSSVGSAPTDPGNAEAEKTAEVSLSHVLNNTIILREFILELAAVVQVRAGLFGEVRFA